MNDGKNSKIRFINFVRATLEDFADSGKSVTKFFRPNAKNKDLFRTKSYMIGNLGREARPEFGLITNYMFGRMFREFHLRRLHRYMPHKDGEKSVFGKHTSKLVMLLGLNMFDEIRAKELGATKEELEGKPSETQIRTSQSESQKRLQAAGFREDKGGMKYNSETGLIEGQVINKNGETLTALIDPSNPESIIFDGANGKEFLSLSDELNLKAVASLTLEERLMLSKELEIPEQLTDLAQSQYQSQDGSETTQNSEFSFNLNLPQKGLQGLQISETQEWPGEESNEESKAEDENVAFKQNINKRNNPTKQVQRLSPSIQNSGEESLRIPQITGRYTERGLEDEQNRRREEQINANTAQNKTQQEKQQEMQAKKQEEDRQKQKKRTSKGSGMGKAGVATATALAGTALIGGGWIAILQTITKTT